MIASGEHSFPSESRRACRRGVNHRFDFIERPDLIEMLSTQCPSSLAPRQMNGAGPGS
jgi:hypothetical protein